MTSAAQASQWDTGESVDALNIDRLGELAPTGAAMDPALELAHVGVAFAPTGGTPPAQRGAKHGAQNGPNGAPGAPGEQEVLLVSTEAPAKHRRSLSAKRQMRFGQRTPLLDHAAIAPEGQEARQPRGGAASPRSSSSVSSRGSFFGGSSPAERGARRHRSDDTFFELSRSGTLHVPGFTVKASGLSPSPVPSEAGATSSATGGARRFPIHYAGQRAGEGKEGKEGKAAASATWGQRAPNRGATDGDVLVVPEEEEAAAAAGGEREQAHFDRADLVFVKRLGRGASGVVHLALHASTLRFVAVKAVPVFDDRKRAQIVAELKALYANLVPLDAQPTPGRAGHCPYIVGLHEGFVSRSESTINLVLEWMDGGSLEDWIKARGAMNERQVASVLHCVLRGLRHLHGSRQLHRDIKPSNLLLSRKTGLVKLSDFGIAHSFGSFSAANTFVGSLSYMAPERISGDEGGYSYAADVWSVGLSALVCATGQYPFQREHDEQGYWGLVHAITEQDSPSLRGAGFRPELCDLVERCLEKDPLRRPSVQELLRHPFLSKHFPYETVVGVELENPPGAQGEPSSAGALNATLHSVLAKVAARRSAKGLPPLTESRAQALADQLSA